MKLVVPFTIPVTREIRAARGRRRTCRGTARPRARRLVAQRRAAAGRRGEQFVAVGAPGDDLLAVTTGIPGSSASATIRLRAGSMPPSTSITRSGPASRGGSAASAVRRTRATGGHLATRPQVGAPARRQYARTCRTSGGFSASDGDRRADTGREPSRAMSSGSLAPPPAARAGYRNRCRKPYLRLLTAASRAAVSISPNVRHVISGAGTARAPHGARTAARIWERDTSETETVYRGFISPGYRAGSSTWALAPGCCGFCGPVPSATLDKRLRRAQNMERRSKPRACQGASSAARGDAATIGFRTMRVLIADDDAALRHGWRCN